MRYNVNPKNGDKLSALGFGCMRFSDGGLTSSFMGRYDTSKAEELLVSAVEQGINYFDTAYIYAGSEEVLGNTLQKHGLRHKVYIATKLPIIMCRKASDFDKFFDTQLKRLKTDYVDYYMLHMLADRNTWEALNHWGIQEWVAKKKATGEIRNFGFSFHGSQEEFLFLLDAYDWDFCQIQYNYSDENYQAGVTGLKAAAAKGIPVMIMEPLLGGKLATNLPKEAMERFREADENRSAASWGFQWLYNQPEVTVVLSGMNAEAQLTDNIQIASDSYPGMMSEEELAVVSDVKKIFNESYRIHCTGCHYCMPCPAGVNIPACFTAYNTSHAISKTQGFQQYLMSTLMNDKPAYASLCMQCGKCEKHCPQELPIREHLVEVRKDMESLRFRVTKRIVPLFLRKNR